MGMNTRYVKEYFYKKKIRSTFVWILEIIAAILLAAAFSWFFCRSVVVQEGSMEPTLVPGERVLMDSAWYRLSSPKRGDEAGGKDAGREKGAATAGTCLFQDPPCPGRTETAEKHQSKSSLPTEARK